MTSTPASGFFHDFAISHGEEQECGVVFVDRYLPPMRT
jgi:hypothetical protein